MAACCIGIDLGGTFIKLGLLDRQLAVTAQDRRPTPAAGGQAVIDAMADAAEDLLASAGVRKSDAAGVGIGSPGPLDLDAGVIIGTPNIPGLRGVALREELTRRLGLPAALDNDANLAALGEFLVGSGRDVRHMVLLTLGTGVGSGIVVDGELLHGGHGIGAEVGHMIVRPGGRPCGCGQRGCLEQYASAGHLARHARRMIEDEGRGGRLADVLAEKGDLDARDVQQAAAAGDPTARRAWDEAVAALADACVSLARVLDPDLIVIGGGMAAAGEALMGPLREQYRGRHWTLTHPRTDLALASLGNDAGVIGAAAAAWRRFG